MAKKTTNWGRFQEADTEDHYRIVGSSQGPGGSGKSHFWLTAPDPIAVQLFDPSGLEGLTRQEEFRGKDIRVIDYEWDPSEITDPEERAKWAEEKLDEFLEDYETARRNARTILWDKEDHVWEMLRLARLGDFTDKPANYHELNLQYRGLIQKAYSDGVNLGLIRGVKKVWGKIGVSGQGKAQYGFTGELEPRGHNEVPELVQVTFDHYWDEESSGFKIRVMEKCRLNPDLMGEEFDAMTFQEMAMLLYPETAETPEVWE